APVVRRRPRAPPACRRREAGLVRQGAHGGTEPFLHMETPLAGCGTFRPPPILDGHPLLGGVRRIRVPADEEALCLAAPPRHGPRCARLPRLTAELQGTAGSLQVRGPIAPSGKGGRDRSAARVKIFFECSEYPPGPHGGIGTLVQLLARGLVRRGHAVRVAGMYPADYPAADREVDEGVEIFRFRERPGRFSWVPARIRFFRLLSRWSSA